MGWLGLGGSVGLVRGVVGVSVVCLSIVAIGSFVGQTLGVVLMVEKMASAGCWCSILDFDMMVVAPGAGS